VNILIVTEEDFDEIYPDILKPYVSKMFIEGNYTHVRYYGVLYEAQIYTCVKDEYVWVMF